MAGQPRRSIVTSLGLLLTALLLVSFATTSADGSTSASNAAERCKRPARGFVPTYAGIPAIGRSVKVIQVQRKSNGQIGAGPTTTEGKWLMSMDPKTKPGSHQGSVLLAGHTWPDGSALGNAMLENLWTGNGIVLSNGDTRACYRVNRRSSYPADEVPSSAFRTSGPEQVVVVACSGKRLGPGNWTRRTLWFATPWTPAPPPEPTSPSPQPSPPPQNCLLCGLLGH
ncbi:MAG: class F sortase [Marmoricola sp.]